MYQLMDATDPGLAPAINHQPQVALFSLLFILFGAFFIVNLCVSVLIDTYSQVPSCKAALPATLRPIPPNPLAPRPQPSRPISPSRSCPGVWRWG